MGATFSRLKNWIAEILTYADLNAEIDNILSNLGPAGVDDYSSNTTQMRTDTDPGESGTESLATSLAGELERIRFAIREIKGSSVSYWYQTGATSLSELASAIGASLVANRITSGKMRTGSSQPLFLNANGAARTIALKGASTNFIYSIAGVQYTISTDITATSLTAAPSSNNTAAVNMPTLAGQAFTKYLGEFGSTIQMDAAGSEITALIGKLAAFKLAGSATEYFIARVDSATQLSNIKRGYFFDSSDAPISRATLTDNDVLTLMKLTWVYATTAGTLAVGYTPPTVGSDEPVSPAIGDYWYDTANSIWKTYGVSSTWGSAAATLVGVCIQDTSNTVASRSFDFFKNFATLNTAKVERASATVCQTANADAEVSIYGTALKFAPGRLTWDTSVDFDSGVTEAASTHYFLYLKESGERIISDVGPYDRTQDLKGLYHPYHAWRCLGQVYNNASSDFVAAIDYSDDSPRNFKVTTHVAASALTVIAHGNPLSKLKLNTFTTTDVALTAQIPFAVQHTIASTNTLGHSNGVQANIFAGIIVEFGVPYLVLSMSPIGGVAGLTTTAGSGSTGTTFYALRTLTAMPVVRIASMLSTQATAGTWATAPTVAMFPQRVAPTIQRFTSGSGTYTKPLGCSYIFVRMVGGGGGGSGSGTASATNGGAGVDTTFGGATAAAGAAGTVQTSGVAGGAASLATGMIGTAIAGKVSGGYTIVQADSSGAGGDGGDSYLYGGGGLGGGASGGAAGIANTGGGGSGGNASGAGNNYSGTGGGGGASIEAWIFAPEATYAYAVGAGGSAGGAGTNGTAGAAGGSGMIEVYEFYD